MTERIAALEQQIAELKRNGVPAAALPSAPRREALPKRDAPANNLQIEGKPDTSKYLPVKNWATVLERFDEVNPSVSGLLQGSNAFANDENGILLMLVKNKLFKKLFSQRDAVMLGSAAVQVLGKKYSIRFKSVETDEEQPAPADILFQRAREQGIEIKEQEESGI